MQPADEPNPCKRLPFRLGVPGIVGSVKKRIYGVYCGDLYYDLQGGGKPSLTIGQGVAFRIEKQKVYLDDGKNDKRYNVVGTGKSDQKQSPQPN